MRFAVRMKEREKSRGTGSYGIFKIMRRGGAKSCKNGLGRDNEIYFGRRITTNFRVGLGRRNKELNGFLGGARDWGEAL